MCWAKQLPAVATRSFPEIEKTGRITGSTSVSGVALTERRQKA
jgi:hypothetical protein